MFSFKLNMNNINFKANYINTVQVQKRIGSNYKPCNASFVEFNPDDKKDVFALKEVSDLWGDCYAFDIKEDFKSDDFKKKNKHVYGLTLQDKNFGYVKPESVLGIVEFQENKDSNNLIFLQVNPENQAYQFGRPEHKKVGTGILDSLKKIYSSKPMKLHSVFSAKNFYKKNGFINDENAIDKLDFIWNA